jgi:HEPN domain-containing protein
MLPEIVREWIEKAEEDYGFACAGIEYTDYFAQICFHFQQAAEKYLKAFIIARKLDFRPVHNLLELLRVCSQAAPDAQRLEEACRFLNPFYIDTRYPVHWPGAYDKGTAVQAKEMAEVIRDWVTRALIA